MKITGRLKAIFLGAASGFVGGLTEAFFSPEDLSYIDSILLKELKERLPESGDYFSRINQIYKTGCKDCSKCAVMYMVKNEVWDKITDGDRSTLLCLWCAEKRLGRRIEVSDLSDAPVNNPVRYFHSLEPNLQKNFKDND